MAAIDKNELVEILVANSQGSWDESKVSDKMVADFNKKYTGFLKQYPGYDPLDTEDYKGKQDDDFIEILLGICEVEGYDLFTAEKDGSDDDTEEELGESLVTEHKWPRAYKGKSYAINECEDALDATYGEMSWSGIKSVISKYPHRVVKSALAKNYSWTGFKDDARPFLKKIAAFCLGPNLDGDVSCWSKHKNAPVIVRNLAVKDLKGDVVVGIMESLTKKFPMSPAIKAAMKHEIIPNMHVKVYESSFEMDANEFADIAAVLNSTAQNLAEIVQGFVSKAIGKAREKSGGEGGVDGNTATDDNQDLLACFEECSEAGSSSDEAIAKCAEEFNISVDRVREILTAMNVNLGGAADTTAANNAAAPAASTDPNAATPKTEAAKQPDTSNPFSLHVNKQYQTASGQVLTLRKMSGGNNPALVFEDENTGDKVEIMKDKFFGMDPKESNIDSTKSRKSLINKFKRRINLSAMKSTAKIIYKTRSGRKVYENLDSIKSGGKPVGDIAGVSVGKNGNGKNQVEYCAGSKVKAGDIEGKIKSFKINENEEPEIIVKTPEGDEVTITVSDFVDSEPVLQTEPLAGTMTDEPVEEHVEYKGFALLQNAEDSTWSVLKDDTKEEGAEGFTEDEAKAWVDAKLEEEEGGGTSTDDGGETETELEDSNESISQRFIKESKDGTVKLKTFSQMLNETRIPGLRKNLVPTKRPAMVTKRPAAPAKVAPKK